MAICLDHRFMWPEKQLQNASLVKIKPIQVSAVLTNLMDQTKGKYLKKKQFQKYQRKKSAKIEKQF